MTSEDQNEPTMEEILASIRRIIRDDTDEEDRNAAAGKAITASSDSDTEDVLELTQAVPDEEEEATPAEQAVEPALDRESAGQAVTEPEPSPGDLPPPEKAADAVAEAAQSGAAMTTSEPEPLEEEEQPLDKADEAKSLTTEEGAAPETVPAPPEALAQPLQRAVTPGDTKDATESTQVRAMSDEQHGSPGKSDSLVSSTSADSAASAFERLREEEDEGGLALGSGTLEGLVKDLLRPILKDWLDENLPAIVERLVQEEIDRVSRRRR